MNYIPQIAQMLGVEIGEEFTIIYEDGGVVDRFKFGSDGNFWSCEDGEWVESMAYTSVLEGRARVYKKPWKPKRNDSYLTWIYVNGEMKIYELLNLCGCSDVMRFRLGNCYPTREAAEADREKWERFYSSEERIDWGDGE